jgi:hypothetical protein
LLLLAMLSHAAETSRRLPGTCAWLEHKSVSTSTWAYIHACQGSACDDGDKLLNLETHSLPSTGL